MHFLMSELLLKLKTQEQLQALHTHWRNQATLLTQLANEGTSPDQRRNLLEGAELAGGQARYIKTLISQRAEFAPSWVHSKLVDARAAYRLELEKEVYENAAA